MNITELRLDLIRIDGGTQARVSIDQTAVAEYAEAMMEGDTLPPVIVIHDGANHWLVDGFHRFHANRKIGAITMAADVRPGTLDDALLFSFGANKDHGLRRSNEDKRKAVLGMLALKPEWSNRAIARHVGVNDTTVAAHRPKPASTPPAAGILHPGIGAVDPQVGAEPPPPDVDPLLDEAITLVKQHNRASISLVQRHLRIGYNRAARLIEQMEEQGVVSAQDLTGNRQVLGAAAPAPAPAAAPAAAPAPAPATAPEPADPPRPDDEEELRIAQKALADATDAFTKALDSDDVVGELTREVKRLTSLNAVLESRMDGLMNEKGELIRRLKGLQRKLDAIEKAGAAA